MVNREFQETVKIFRNFRGLGLVSVLRILKTTLKIKTLTANSPAPFKQPWVESLVTLNLDFVYLVYKPHSVTSVRALPLTLSFDVVCFLEIIRVMD